MTTRSSRRTSVIGVVSATRITRPPPGRSRTTTVLVASGRGGFGGGGRRPAVGVGGADRWSPGLGQRGGAVGGGDQTVVHVAAQLRPEREVDRDAGGGASGSPCPSSGPALADWRSARSSPRS
ncbi:MAG: hypothetical protein ABIZ05_12895 [Pseudonocardiaceae bacterium]